MVFEPKAMQLCVKTNFTLICEYCHGDTMQPRPNHIVYFVDCISQYDDLLKIISCISFSALIVLLL